MDPEADRYIIPDAARDAAREARRYASCDRDRRAATSARPDFCGTGCSPGTASAAASKPDATDAAGTD